MKLNPAIVALIAIALLLTSVVVINAVSGQGPGSHEEDHIEEVQENGHPQPEQQSSEKVNESPEGEAGQAH